MICHSGTKKEEVIVFVNENKGKRIELNYECNISPTWGDDDVFIFDTSIEKFYDEIIDVIETHYIHGIKIMS